MFIIGKLFLTERLILHNMSTIGLQGLDMIDTAIYQSETVAIP